MEWKERIRDPKAECASRDEMMTLQGRKLVDLVNRVYGKVPFYTKKMKEMGVEPGDIKGIEDIVKLPFTTKEDLRANYPFGLLAVPQSEVARVQGSSGTTGKLTLASYTQNDADLLGRMCGQMSDDGGTYRGGQDSCMLWIRPIHRRNGTGSGGEGSGSDGNPYVSGKYPASDDVHGGFRSYGICVHPFLCASFGRIYGRGRCGRPLEN